MELKRSFTSDSRTDESVQSHLWDSMGINELHQQQELVLNEIRRMQDVLNTVAFPDSLIAMIQQAQAAVKHIDSLIEIKSQQKSTAAKETNK